MLCGILLFFKQFSQLLPSDLVMDKENIKLIESGLFFSVLLTACDFVGAVNFSGRKGTLLLQQRRKQMLR